MALSAGQRQKIVHEATKAAKRVRDAIENAPGAKELAEMDAADVHEHAAAAFTARGMSADLTSPFWQQ